MSCLTVLGLPLLVIASAACSSKPTRPPDSREAECHAQWSAVPAAAAETPFDQSWLSARCTIAGADRVRSCIDECSSMHDRGRALCWSLRAAGCVQEAATRAAIISGLAAKAVDYAREQKATAQGSRLELPAELATLALRGAAWSAQRDGALLVYLPTWSGRQTNTAGMLYRDVAWPEGDKELVVPGLPFETAGGKAPPVRPEPEPFTIAERLDDHWLLVHYGWD